MGSTPLGGCIGYFLKFLFSNFRSHIKESKWGRKYILMNYTCCNGSPQKIPFQFANGKLPRSRCRAFWAKIFMIVADQYMWYSNEKVKTVGDPCHVLKKYCVELNYVLLHHARDATPSRWELTLGNN